MMDLDRFRELKEKADRLRKRRDQAEGALEQSLALLKKNFGVGSLDEARKKLETLEAEKIEAEEEAEQALEKFEKKWGEKLASVD